jgi:hypothetical protein
MRNRNGSIHAFAVLAGALVILSACAAPQPAGLTDEQVSALTENALTALNEGDYARFTQDFSGEMLAAIPEEQFVQLRDMVQASSGDFISIGKPTMTNAQGYAVYRFPCQFDLEEVTVTITFKINGDKVEGLFFDSPNLRSAGG